MELLQPIISIVKIINELHSQDSIILKYLGAQYYFNLLRNLKIFSRNFGTNLDIFLYFYFYLVYAKLLSNCAVTADQRKYKSVLDVSEKLLQKLSDCTNT